MPQATDIISLAEAKSFLNLTNNNSDAELADFISRASRLWVRQVGPVAGSPAFDEWYDGGGVTIALLHPPVQSITLITEAFADSISFTLTNDPLDGTGSAGAYGYTLDQTTGLITRRANGVPMAFAPGRRNVHVQYVAGYATTPDDIKESVLEILRHLWASQRGAARGASQGDPSQQTGTPWGAQEVIDAYRVPGIG